MFQRRWKCSFVAIQFRNTTWKWTNMKIWCFTVHVITESLWSEIMCALSVWVCVCVWLCLLESIVQYIRQPCHVHVAAAGYRRCSRLWVMRWHEQHGLRAKRRSSMSRFTISPSFSLLSLLPLSSLLDDPSCSLPTRLSFCPSSRVAVFHFFSFFFYSIASCSLFNSTALNWFYFCYIHGPWREVFANWKSKNCEVPWVQRKTRAPDRTRFVTISLRRIRRAWNRQIHVTKRGCDLLTQLLNHFSISECGLHGSLVGLNECLTVFSTTI